VRGSDSGFRSRGPSDGQNHVIVAVGYDRLTRTERWLCSVGRGRLRGSGQTVHFVVEYDAGARRHETAAEATE